MQIFQKIATGGSYYKTKEKLKKLHFSLSSSIQRVQGEKTLMILFGVQNVQSDLRMAPINGKTNTKRLFLWRASICSLNEYHQITVLY